MRKLLISIFIIHLTGSECIASDPDPFSCQDPFSNPHGSRISSSGSAPISTTPARPKQEKAADEVFEFTNQDFNKRVQRFSLQVLQPDKLNLDTYSTVAISSIRSNGLPLFAQVKLEFDSATSEGRCKIKFPNTYFVNSGSQHDPLIIRIPYKQERWGDQIWPSQIDCGGLRDFKGAGYTPLPGQKGSTSDSPEIILVKLSLNGIKPGQLARPRAASHDDSPLRSPVLSTLISKPRAKQFEGASPKNPTPRLPMTSPFFSMSRSSADRSPSKISFIFSKILVDSGNTYHLFDLILAGNPRESVEGFSAKTFHLDINHAKIPVTVMAEADPHEANRIRFIFRYPPEYLKAPTHIQTFGVNLPPALRLRPDEVVSDLQIFMYYLESWRVYPDSALKNFYNQYGSSPDMQILKRDGYIPLTGVKSLINDSGPDRVFVNVSYQTESPTIKELPAAVGKTPILRNNQRSSESTP